MRDIGFRARLVTEDPERDDRDTDRAEVVEQGRDQPGVGVGVVGIEADGVYGGRARLEKQCGLIGEVVGPVGRDHGRGGSSGCSSWAASSRAPP